MGVMSAGLGSGVSGLLGKDHCSLFSSLLTQEPTSSADKRDELRLSNDVLSGLNLPDLSSLTVSQPSGDHVLRS